MGGCPPSLATPLLTNTVCLLISLQYIFAGNGEISKRVNKIITDTDDPSQAIEKIRNFVLGKVC